MAISRNKKQPTAKKSRVKNATITNLADFDPETTLLFYGSASFQDYPEITHLGNLQTIKGYADFENSQVQHLGNLQTIGGSALFENSQVQSLGNLKTIGGYAYFKNSQVQSLGNLQEIGQSAYFGDSQVEDLGNLQTIEGGAFFNDSKVQDLGNLQTIGGDADFRNSQVQSLGNLQTIGRSAIFGMSQVDNLGNLQKIGGGAYFGNRTDLQGEWELRQKDNDYAEGGGVGRKLIFESREYDMPRGKTIYEVEVEDPYDDGETIKERYDNYDEAIDAYQRSEIQFTPTWRTYLETNKPPYVYEGGIVLPNGTLKVLYRKGRDVRHDWNGNEIVS